MDNMIKIQHKNGNEEEIIAGLQCINLVKDHQNKFKFDIIAAKIDNELVGLNEKINKSCVVELLDSSSVDGNEVYVHGLKYIFIKAVKDILGLKSQVLIEHSIDKGIYCHINGSIDQNIVNKIKTRMKEIVEETIPFEKITVARKEALEYFKKIGRLDKVGTLNYLTQTNVTLYKLGNMYDYFFGIMPLHTGYIKRFELTFIEPNGIVLRFPTFYSPDNIPEYTHHQKIFKVFREYDEWGKIIGINDVVDLNDKVIKGATTEIIRISEIYQNNKLYEIANIIHDKKETIKIVLIAGPSSSGKTTMSHKLSLYLKSKGLNPNPIGLDDYYIDRIDTPKDENGEYDYESIDAIDIELFNNHLGKLLNGEEVNIPKYNFITGKREYSNKLLKLQKNDILVIEGLHGLNEKLTVSIPKQNKFKIYISPLTVLNIDNHNRVSTTLVRKLRRMVRDYKHRGNDAVETMSQWEKVRAGEEKHVFPFQDEADVIFNTALIYELSVLKTYAEPLLFSIDEKSVYYAEARKLIKFLNNFLPIPADEIPEDSLIREFIGGSCF